MPFLMSWEVVLLGSLVLEELELEGLVLEELALGSLVLEDVILLAEF